MEKSTFSVFRVLPMVFVMGSIFFLSHQPGDSFDLPSVVHLDKVLHGLIYFILGFFTCFALPESSGPTRSRTVIVFVTMICLGYGITDELHQSFIPGRYPSVADLVADCLGGFTGALFYGYLTVYIKNKSSRHTPGGVAGRALD